MVIKRQFGKNRIIYGTMASGKSIELIRHLHIYQRFAKKFDYTVQVFKPSLDTRKLKESQTFLSLSSRIGGIEFAQHVTAIRSSSDILDLVNGNSRHVIAVDEVQLLDSGIINVIKKLSNAQNHIIVAGLDKSFRGDWFPLSDFKCSMADVIELFEPEDRIHLLASCEVCGDNAEFVQRLINGKPAPYFDPLIVIGDKNIGSGTEVRSYEPRCQHHFEVPFAEEWSLTKYLLKNRVPKEEILRIISCADKILERLQAEQSPVDSKLSNN